VEKASWARSRTGCRNAARRTCHPGTYTSIVEAGCTSRKTIEPTRVELKISAGFGTDTTRVRIRNSIPTGSGLILPPQGHRVVDTVTCCSKIAWLYWCGGVPTTNGYATAVRPGRREVAVVLITGISGWRLTSLMPRADRAAGLPLQSCLPQAAPAATHPTRMRY
jgi:hypothetical protein